MVGATLACALAECGLRVAVIEATPPGDDAGVATDPRVVAITRASQRILAHLGVWDAIAARRVSPFREMRVWDASGSGAIHFDAADLGEATLGYIVENNVIQAALWARMQQHANLTLVCPATVQTLHVAADHARVGLEDGRSLTAALIVGADGGRSQVRQLAGIATQGWSYAQHAVVATVRPEQQPSTPSGVSGMDSHPEV